MKTIFTSLLFFFLRLCANAQSYSGTIVSATPLPGETITVNFAWVSGGVVPNLVIYAYNSLDKTYTALTTTPTFGGLAYYSTYTVPSTAPNNTILQFTVGTNTTPPTFYGSVASATVLPVVFKNFTGSLFGTNKVNLKWDLANTDGIANSIIFRSTDGNNFIAIDTIKGSSAQNSYEYTDLKNDNNVYFYKIAVVNVDGNKVISNTILINKAGASNSIKILNNGQISNQLFLTGIDLNNYKPGDINIIDIMGRKYQATIRNNNTLNFNYLKPSMYYLKIGANQPLNFIIQ